jgi:uncharacterized protein (AIM24 family)
MTEGGPLEQYQEVETGEAFALQGSGLLKVELDQTSVFARQGAMVAYQGEVHFEHRGGGIGRFLKTSSGTSASTLLLTARAPRKNRTCQGRQACRWADSGEPRISVS